MKRKIKSEKCSEENKIKKRNKEKQDNPIKDRLIHTFLISPCIAIDSGTAIGYYQQQDEILIYLITGKVCLVHKCTTMFEIIAELICY